MSPPMRLYRSGRVIHAVEPLTFVLPSDDSLRTFDEDGGWPELATIRGMIDRFPDGKTFVDVGANVGAWTLAFAAEPRVGHVDAFEPFDEIHGALSASVVINRLSGKVSLRQMALGSPDQVGEQILHVPDPGGAGCTLLDTATLPGWAVEHDRPRPVRCATMDHFALQNVGLIKLDVEGNEIEVWRGMGETLRRNGWPTVIFEAWSHPWFAERREQLRNYVQSMDYGIDTVTFGDMWLAERMTP